MKNVFDLNDSKEYIDRVNKLTLDSKSGWGEMSVDQMFAHCNVAYEMALEDNHAKPGKFKVFLIKSLIKPMVCSEKPYKKSGRTHPAFLIKDKRVFENEKNRLINYIKKTQELGGDYFDNKESHSMGALTTTEWNNMFSKHLNHHLTQFGV
jgi:hypothetical protein